MTTGLPPHLVHSKLPRCRLVSIQEQDVTAAAVQEGILALF